MKKVINGKAYDTEKAKPVAHWKNWGSWRDFEHIEETLYRKRTGEFFLFGEGGPKTKYAEREGQNCWTDGSKIIPLSWEAARKWAEEHLDADKYAEIFEVAEDNEKQSFPSASPAQSLNAPDQKRLRQESPCLITLQANFNLLQKIS